MEKFGHYSLNDPKLGALVAKYGMEGYGTYWRIREILVDQGETMFLDEIPNVASALHVTEALVTGIIKETGLFVIDEERDAFISIRMR